MSECLYSSLSPSPPKGLSLEFFVRTQLIALKPVMVDSVAGFED